MSAERGEILIALRARDLFGDRHAPDANTRLRLAGIRSRLREIAQRTKALRAGAALPFSFAAHFSDVAAAGGFNVIIGNPPWVRVHHIAEISRERLRRDFAVYRNAAWESGATFAGAGRGFAAQIDLSSLFVERSCELLRPGGTMALLLPAKLWCSLAGGGVRQLLVGRMDIVALEDLAESHSQFDAAVYPSLLVARKRTGRSDDSRPAVRAAVRTSQGTIRWS
jgi:Eco57I restriction endonuclease.